jgi:hypothetical protein
LHVNPVAEYVPEGHLMQNKLSPEVPFHGPVTEDVALARMTMFVSVHPAPQSSCHPKSGTSSEVVLLSKKPPVAPNLFAFTSLVHPSPPLRYHQPFPFTK